MFPLQLHGYDVSPIHTVQFSNHTGYPSWKGSIATGKEIDELIEGLEANKLLTFPYLITGYMGSIDCLSHLSNVIQTLKSNVEKDSDSKLFFACDPVFGDNGKLYAPSFEPFISVYKKEIIQYADLLTPNQTEASFLLDKMEIKSLSDAYSACNAFHDMGIRYVVITSIDIEEDLIHLVFSDKMREKEYGYLEIEK